MEELLGRLFDWIFRRIGRRVVVKRVVSPHDKDLDAAFELYSRRLPENERDSFENIIRWLEECSRVGKQEDAMFRDYLVVAKTAGKVCGIFYGTYYLRTRLLLVGYLVRDNRSKRGALIVPAILKYMTRLFRAELKECKGVAFEIEHYAHADTPNRAKHCRRREDHFRGLLRRHGLVVKPLAFDYRQPRLSLWDSDSKEEPQILLYGRIRPPAVGNTLPKSEVAAILDTIYNDWYGDCYADNPERDREYRAYLRRLYEETIAALPEEVPTDRKERSPPPSQIIAAGHWTSRKRVQRSQHQA
jgi:hypothetical protein